MQSIAAGSAHSPSSLQTTRILPSPVSLAFLSVFPGQHRMPSVLRTIVRQATSKSLVSLIMPPSTNAASVIPDPLHMAPLRVGDYIEYSGVQYNGETIVYGLVANIDIRTSGTQPGFVRVEDAIVGIGDTGADVEAARSRFIGLATRSDLLISIYAVDQNPCTGKETERLITSVTPDGSNRNKWSIDVPRNINNGFYTRNYHIKIGNSITETSDGIKAGLYVQPGQSYVHSLPLFLPLSQTRLVYT